MILIDDVVQKIDMLAHTRGTSRSNLVNQILADYVSLLTPQKRVGEIFEHLARAAGGGGILRVQQTSASVLLLKSALNYRYSPTIRYSVEIAPDGGRYVCEFKVSSRSQSDGLLAGLNVFFELWSQIEHGMLRSEPRFSITGGRFRRWLEIERDGETYDSQVLGKAVGAYIRLFDKSLKLCFGAEHGVDMQAYEHMSGQYRKYLDECEVIL